jgi:AraC-like DNA-binding protein
MLPTTISSWALVIWRALAAQGVDADALFRRAGLDPATLKDSNARYPVSAMTRLWHTAVAATDDPCFGLTAAQHWHPTSLHALGFAWLASHTLRESLERAVRYGRIVSNATQLALVVREGEARLVFTRPHPTTVVADTAVHAGLALMVNLARASCGADFHPHRVWLRQARSACAPRLRAFFHAPVEYDARENALGFAASALNRPLATANAALAEANDRVAAQYLARFDRQDVAARLRAHLLESLPSGAVSEATAARALQLSRRSLQRKLHEAGTSFTRLLEATRRELALQYLKDSSVSVSEVAYLLGFSEVANFTRAFRRWEGVAPRAYRQALA